MLEAFLHDPLISWNLEGRAVKDETAQKANTVAADESTLSLDERVQASMREDSGVTGAVRGRAASEAEGEQQDERSRGLQAFGVVKRIQAKLHGTDFAQLEAGSAPLDTPTQVSRLIAEAQSHANLCQMYHGWNP